jgi:hypothetical protein
MSDFVEQCRSEWKRLGVPDPLAEEMAADLASDLRDAEGEGVSAEEYLGSSVFDPRSFAASGRPSEVSSPYRAAEGTLAADRSFWWRSPPSQRSHWSLRRCCS